MEKGFNYKEYLAEGWLFKEDKRSCILKEAKTGESQKDLYNKRAERSERGNWKGSIGKFVETHGPDITQAFNSGTLEQFVRENIIPELSDEEREKLEQKLGEFKGNQTRLLEFLYDVCLKGSGNGGYRAHGLRMEGAEGSGDDDQAWLASLVWDKVNAAEENGDISGESYTLQTSDPQIFINCQGSALRVSFDGGKTAKPLERLSPEELERAIAAAEEGLPAVQNARRQGNIYRS